MVDLRDELVFGPGIGNGGMVICGGCGTGTVAGGVAGVIGTVTGGKAGEAGTAIVGLPEDISGTLGIVDTLGMGELGAGGTTPLLDVGGGTGEGLEPAGIDTGGMFGIDGGVNTGWTVGAETGRSGVRLIRVVPVVTPGVGFDVTPLDGEGSGERTGVQGASSGPGVGTIPPGCDGPTPGGGFDGIFTGTGLVTKGKGAGADGCTVTGFPGGLIPGFAYEGGSTIGDGGGEDGKGL